MNEPFKDVDDFAHYHGIIVWVGYGEHHRTDIAEWIKENYFDSAAKELLDSLAQGKTEDRPRIKLYNWKDLIY